MTYIFFNFLLSFLLCCMLLTTSYCYMIFEEKQNSDNYSINNNKIKIPDLPPISIVVTCQKGSKKISAKLAILPLGKGKKRNHEQGQIQTHTNNNHNSSCCLLNQLPEQKTQELARFLKPVSFFSGTEINLFPSKQS
uniref:Uncharacterized protein n=1 Tax=Laticauda laticaudata TaxID=8630 RepID=A0A8C5S3X2_LATLA